MQSILKCLTLTLNSLIPKAKIYHGKNYSPKVKSNDPLKDELRHFFKCVKTKKKPITDINFAKKYLKL